MVFIESYENYVVEEVITSSHRITDKYGKTSLVLDPEDKEVKFIITRGGQEISLKDLKEWDVLSVAKSKDGNIVIVEVTTESITGKVEERNGEKVVISGQEYKVAANYPEEINLNDEGTFYLDKDRNIAAVDATSGLSSNYAYMVNADLTTGFDKYLQVKIFDKTGAVKVLKSGEKIKFNGKTGMKPQDVLSALKSGGDTAVSQLITFEVNKDGTLMQLNTANDKGGAIDKTAFTLNANETLKYKKSSGKLGNYRLNSSTVVFDIPEGQTDTEKFSVENIDLFEDETDYDVLVYDAGEDYTAKAVVVTNSGGIANLEASAAVIEKITTTTNSDNLSVEKLYAFVDGEKKSFVTADDGILVNAEGEKLQPGDIIQMKTNAKGEIENIRVLFESADMQTESEHVIDEDLVTVYGKVMKKFTNSVNVSVNGGSVVNYRTDNAKVYEFNSKKTTNPIKVAESGDSPQYDEMDESRVFIRIYKDEVKEIVIVR